MQDYRKYTIPTDVCGKVFTTDLCGKVFSTDLGGRSSPTGDLGKIRTLVSEVNLTDNLLGLFPWQGFKHYHLHQSVSHVCFKMISHY